MTIPAPESARCVLLFARSARAEAGAKRMGRAAALFALARRRVAAAAAQLGVDLVVVGPAGEAPSGDRFIAQVGRTFGERLAHAFAAAAALGYREVVAVPTDVPQLGSRQLGAAFAALAAGAATVLGPSPDGGVYLLGVRGPAAPLLAGVRWRTARTLGDLAARASGPVFLECLGDVDREADLRILAALAGAAALDPEAARLVALLLPATAVAACSGPSVARDPRLSPRLPARAPPALPAVRV